MIEEGSNSAKSMVMLSDVMCTKNRASVWVYLVCSCNNFG